MQQSGRLFWRNGFVCGCRRQKAELRFSHAGYRCLLVAKGSKHSLRLLFFAAFWSAKSGAKTDPPTKKAKRRGLTLAPGDYSRVCKQTVPSARAFSPHLSERLFCQAGVVRRGTWREGCVRNKQEAQKPTIAPGSGFKPPHYRSERKKEHSPARVPGAGGCKGLILLRPLNAGRRRLPRRTTCGWFWCYLLPSKGSYTPRAKTAVNRRPKSGNNPGSPEWDRANETARQGPRKKAAPEEAARKYSILFNIRCRQKLYCSITFTRLACPLSFDMSLREP